MPLVVRRARIANTDHDEITRQFALPGLPRISRADGDDSAIRHRIARIHAQIQYDQLPLGRINLDGPQIIGEFPRSPSVGY
jgi:hypothetical protein